MSHHDGIEIDDQFLNCKVFIGFNELVQLNTKEGVNTDFMQMFGQIEAVLPRSIIFAPHREIGQNKITMQIDRTKIRFLGRESSISLAN